jgi:D-alanyl-D-alanine carboxypeptidase/D-alanyl-D-alanine-endopeptidase (penicillin-binding protein 4)
VIFFKCFIKKIIIFSLILNINVFVVFAGVKDLSSKNLVKKIDAIISKHLVLHTGVEIYSTKKKKVIYSKNQNQLFIPASNTKIFSSLLALDVLGKDYRFETLILTDGYLGLNSVEGNLYIVGSGDPSLTSIDVDSLFKSLQKIGIKKINGDFCVDKGVFDSEYFAPGSTIDCIGQSWFNFVDSLIIDRKSVSINQVNCVNFINEKKLDAMFFDGIKFFEYLFAKYNIVLNGKIVCKNFIGDKKAAIILSHKSKKLYELLSVMMKDSDNLYADCMFKKAGSVKYNSVGTWESGLEALKNFLKNKVGISSSKIKIYDGSGLSRYNLVSAEQIVKLLSWAYKQTYYDCFISILSVAGVDGTLKNRMVDLAPNVKAKTGSLAGVSALSGYIKACDDTLVFSILNGGYISKSINSPSCKLELEDAICRLLAN